jgi:hypothetical protein
MPAWMFSALLVLLFGAIALPMLPVWQGGVRALAVCAALTVIVASPGKRLLFAAISLSALALSSAAWLQSLVSSPVGHVIHALTDVFGQPLGLLPDTALLVGDVAIVSVLLPALALRPERTTRTFALGLAIFFGWGVLGWAVHGLRGADPDTLARMATGLSAWASWVYWAALMAWGLSDQERLRQAMTVVGFATLTVGMVIGIQWSIHDSSYVIATIPGVSEGFQRVRGTDYYHAPAAFAVGLGVLAWVGLLRRGRLLMAGSVAAFLLAMMLLNNTRAVSLSIAGGSCVLLLGLLLKRAWLKSVLVAIVLGVVAQNVFYLKPSLTREEVPPATASTGHPASASARASASGSSTSVAALANANAARSSLAHGGLHMLAEKWGFGHGVGTLALPLEGDAFNGLLSTYSTHVLFLDIALMAGLPALLAFIAVFGVAGWSGWIGALKQRMVAVSHLGFSALSMLLSFIAVSLFLPQERNELIGVAFALAGMAVALSTRNTELQDPCVEMSPPTRMLALVALAAFAWAVLTSPRYIFPVIELAGRYGAEIVREKQFVYVNEPYFRPLLAALLQMRGADADRVHVLQDTEQVMALEQAWVLWNPVQRGQFPRIVEALGPPRHPHRNQALAITLPYNWWLMPSAQPVVSFIFAGARQEPLLSIPAGAPAAPLVLPNYAPFADIRLGASIGGNAAYVSDFNFGSAVSWAARDGAEIGFVVPYMSERPLRIYRLVALANRSMQRVATYGWTLEGSNDERVWSVLDRREGVALSQNAAAPSSFSLHGMQSFSRYRVRFDAVADAGAANAGLSELEMYFAPSNGAN